MLTIRKIAPLLNCATKELICQNRQILKKSFEVRRLPERFQSSDNSTYKAALLKEFKKPLIVENIKQEKLKEKELRIGVHYCSLNYTDVKILSGARDIKLPIIPGYEFSGEILDVGDNCTEGFKVGDRVVALQGHLPCGGGLAGEAIVSETDCWLVENVSLKDAAILPYGHGTAMLAFTKYCQLNENDVVIVAAGPGGLGLGAIEVAASVFKAKVIAICDTEDSSMLIRDEGAFQAISMREGYPNVYKYLRNALGKKRANLIYDTVGQGTLHVLHDFLDPEKGCVLSAYPFFDRENFNNEKPKFELKPKYKMDTTELDKLPPLDARIQHIDLSKCRQEDVDLYKQIIQDTLTLYEEELISAHVSKVFELDDLDDAIDFILKKKCTGKVLIEIREQIKEKIKKDKVKEENNKNDKIIEEQKKKINDKEKKKVE